MLRRLPVALFAVLLAAAVALPARAAFRVAVVKSDDLTPYNEVVTGFSVETRAEITEYDLGGGRGDDGEVLGRVKALRPNLVLAIGPRAANLVARGLADVPVIFTMVPNWDKYGLTGRNVTGISLQRPVKAQLETLRAVSPKTRRVGVLYDPRYSEPVIDGARRAGGDLGLTLVPAKVRSADEVPSASKAFVGKVDAIWMIADRSVSNVTAFRHLVEFSYENRIPTFALAESQVREGALVSLTPNYVDIGRQAGRLAARIRGGTPAGSIPVAAPEGLEIALNLSTAKRIGVHCDLALEIFTFAAKHGYPIKVFE